MKDIDEIRRDNLRAESVRLGGDADLARELKKDKNQIYQWLRAEGKQRRNMRKAMARLMEIRLGHPAGWIDTEHDARTTQLGASPSPATVESRPKNNVKALRIAIQSLFVVLHERMPDMAEYVARDIVDFAGKDFAGQGFANTLLGNLRGAEHMSEDERLAPRPIRGEQASKRAVSVAKKT